MKLKNIKISNYRCFKKAEIDFDDHITLVVGKNGAGKTAILDTIAVSVSTFLLGIDGGVSRSILKEDARYEFHNLNGTIDPQHQFPVIIETMGNCLNRSGYKVDSFFELRKWQDNRQGGWRINRSCEESTKSDHDRR